MFSVFLLAQLLALAIACPIQEDISPCICHRPLYNDVVTCSKLDSDQDLTRVLGSLHGKTFIHFFEIQNSSFNYIPSDAFSGLKINDLEIKSTSFRGLTDTSVAFEGLEDHLEVLRIVNCNFMNEWNWSVLKNLKKLSKLEIIEDNLENIDDMDKISIPNLSIIGLEDNRISYIQPHAFANFKRLSYLSLHGNKITELRRTMFPNPALALKYLIISNNEIEELPSDLFINMPKLAFLSVAFNKILILKESTFSPIWNQLNHLNVLGNALRCDCRMAWIVKGRFPTDTRAVCSQPKELKGKSIKRLISKDLWCFQ